MIAVAPKPPAPLPPVSAEFVNTLHLADPKIAPQQSVSRLFRASDGKTRLDVGQSSVITIPAQKQSISLNHLKKEARIMPMPADAMALPPPPTIPGMPAPLKPPPLPAVNAKDLGKKMMDGHEVHGKEYTVHPPHVQMPHFPTPPMPAPPKVEVPKVDMPKEAAMACAPKLEAPKVEGPKLAGAKIEAPKIQGPKIAAPHLDAQVPQPPDLPKVPQAPKPPAIPAMLPPPPPLPPPSPVVTEVWSSTQHAIPMLTKTTGSFGQQVSQCKKLAPGEPPPSLFQIPPGYKIV